MRNDFAIINELGYTVNNGLCVHLDDTKNNTERLYFDEAKKLGVRAVFFRRFFKKEEKTETPFHSEPAVCIFQKTETFFNSKAHKQLHAALWSEGKVEIYIIQSPTRIDIINARKPAKRISPEALEVDESLVLASEALNSFNDHRFSAHLFGSGTFWGQPDFIEKIDGNSSPYIYMLDYLMQVRKIFLESQELNLKASTLDKLLVVCILVKFLEEIKDDNGKHTLRKIYKTYKVNDFTEALEQKLCIDILNNLATEFNGKIFDTFSEAEKGEISKANLNLISQFLRANINLQTKQYFIWEQFSFKHLPAEVISAIYENFIQAEALRKKGTTEKGVVYTPIHLVNLLVDEAMPLEEPRLFKDNTFKVLDPACGSGVFLVAAYKRLLQWWTINNSRNGVIKYPDKKIARRILEDNIFGIDIEETATLVSIFGLTIALLDKLTPKEIWNNLKFRNLKERNIKKENFFTWAQSNEAYKKNFDLVIGNPPFNPPSGISKKDVAPDNVLSLFEVKSKDIPNNNIALKFLEGALYFGKKISLIIPANVILYNKSVTAQKYRRRIFSDYTVSKIYDFTHLRRSLFHKAADTPVVAFTLENQSSNQKAIEHIVVKRELLSEKKIRFEIDYYDKHKVRWDWAIDEKKQFIWKANLLGGGRLFHLIYRLSLLNTFGYFIQSMKIDNEEWAYSVGFKLKGGKLKENVKYIFNKSCIITETFDESEKFETFLIKEKNFAAPRDEKIYKPPHIILKLNVGKNNIPVHYSEKYLCFKDKLIGLHAPENQKKTLKKIYEKFKAKEFASLSRFWIYSTSAELLVNLETTCKKEDIDDLPFPTNEEHLILSKPENILKYDVLNYYIHLGKSITNKGAGNIFYESVVENELEEYGKTLCTSLNEIYARANKSWQMGKIIQTSMFVQFKIRFGKNEGLKYNYLKNLDHKLLLSQHINLNNDAIHNRIIRFYKHENGYDCIYLIKPNTKRYWLKSIALRDADDTFMDLKKAGF